MPRRRAGGRSIPAPVPVPGWLPWVAGLVPAALAAALVLWPWIDPRYDLYGPADAHNHVIRIYFLDQLLRRGALFPRWWPDLALGYGYPLFNFYSPLAYYVAEGWRLTGASVYRSAQLLGAVAVALGVTGAYALGAWLFRSPPASLLLACAYVLAPYPFLTNLYGDVTLPQALGLGLLPWLLAFAWCAVRRPRTRYPLALAATLAALVLTHSLTALIAAGVLVPWIGGAVLDAPRGARRAGLGRALTGVGAGLALSAFFWLPALAEQRDVHVDLGRLAYLRFDRSLWPLPLDLSWTYPQPRSGSGDSPKASAAQVVLLAMSALAALCGWLATRRRATNVPPRTPSPGIPRWTLAGAAAVAAATLALNAAAARPLWEHLPLLSNLQFAWRLLGPFSLAVATVAAGAFAALARTGQPQWALAGLLTAYVAVNALPLRPPGPPADSPIPPSPGASAARADESSHLVAVAGTTSTGEFLPRSVSFAAPPETLAGGRAAFEARYPEAGWIAGRVWPFAGTVRVLQVWDGPAGTRAAVEVDGPGPARVAFRTFVFPGWRGYVDGRPAPLRTPPEDPESGLGFGFAVVDVPPGAHTVELALGSTPWRTAGALVALAGAALLAVLACRAVAPPGVALRLMLVAGAAFALAGAFRLAADVRAASAPPWPLPGNGRPGHQAIVLDLSGALLAGDGSPPGARAEPQSLDGQTRVWIGAALPAGVSAEVAVPERAVFQVGLGIEPPPPDATDERSVRFTVEAIEGDGDRALLLDEAMRPHLQPEDRGWRFVFVDLGAYAGQEITLVLRAVDLQEGPSGAAVGRAGWADPTVYVDRSSRYPPPPPVVPPPVVPPPAPIGS